MMVGSNYGIQEVISESLFVENKLLVFSLQGRRRGQQQTMAGREFWFLLVDGQGELHFVIHALRVDQHLGFLSLLLVIPLSHAQDSSMLI